MMTTAVFSPETQTKYQLIVYIQSWCSTLFFLVVLAFSKHGSHVLVGAGVNSESTTEDVGSEREHSSCERFHDFSLPDSNHFRPKSNRGVGGDTTRNMLMRFDRDVLAHEPDWVSMAIGVNDVWRFFDPEPNDAVSLEEFEANYRRLIEPLHKKAGLILVSPFLIEPNRNDPFRARVDAYAAVVKRLALEFEAVFVPFQEAFDASSLEPSMFSDDCVHPNETGSRLMAATFLRAIGA